MSESRIYRRVILTIMSAILAITLFCLTLAVIVIIQFGVEAIPLNAVNHTPYYSEQSAALESRVKDLTRQCNLPESIVDQIFDSDEILAFTKEYTANCIRGFEDTLETAPVRERLRANLYYYMDENNMDMATLDMDALNSYLSQAASLYTQTVNNGFIVNYHSLRSTLISPAVAALFICLATAVISMVFMYKLTGMRRKMLSYTIRGTLSCAILCGTLALWRFAFHGQTGVRYSPEYMGHLNTYFENFFFGQFAAGCVVWILVSALCAGIMLRIKYHRKEK